VFWQAYYLKYRQDRAGYVQNWWNIVNWEFVEDMYDLGPLGSEKEL